MTDVHAAVRALEATMIPVAVGGDGTVNLVARALQQLGVTDRPLGVVPLGTGNALAHDIGVGTIDAAVLALTRGPIVTRDVMITDHPDAPLALLSLSAGLEAGMMRALARQRRRAAWMGFVAAAGAAFHSRRVAIRLVADGERLCDPSEPVFNAGLYNTSHYAFGRRVFPRANAADGWGEAVVCRDAVSYGRLLGAGLRIGDQREGIRATSWRYAILSTPGPLQVDGESVPGGRAVNVRLVPAGLSVLAPQRVLELGPDPRELPLTERHQLPRHHRFGWVPW